MAPFERIGGGDRHEDSTLPDSLANFATESSFSFK
jgi:hypothetical protein